MIDGGKVMRAVKREVKTLIQCFSLQGRGEELKRKKKVRTYNRRQRIITYRT